MQETLLMQGGYGRVLGWEKASSALLVLGFVSSSTGGWQGLAGGTGRWITQSSTARNSLNISHIMPNKSFPVSRVFTDRRQQHPRAVQAVLAVQLE